MVIYELLILLRKRETSEREGKSVIYRKLPVNEYTKNDRFTKITILQPPMK